jgi:hypothetical protein
MANDTPIEHVIRGHQATLLFDRDGFIITPQEINVERSMGVQSFQQKSYLRWNEQLEKVECSR